MVNLSRLLIISVLAERFDLFEISASDLEGIRRTKAEWLDRFSLELIVYYSNRQGDQGIEVSMF